MAQSDERRRWPRLEVALKIKVKPLATEEEKAEEFYYTRNISTGGLLFESGAGEAPPQGGIYDVEISMPLAKYGFATARRLEARGKVCRLEGREQKAGVALEFVAPPRFVTP